MGWGIPFVCELVSHHCIDILTVKGSSETVAKLKAAADPGMRLKQVSNCSLVRILQPGKSTSCSLYPVLEEEGSQKSTLMSHLLVLLPTMSQCVSLCSESLPTSSPNSCLTNLTLP